MRLHQRRRGPDLRTVFRNMLAPRWRMSATQAACHRIATRWGHQCGSCAARASITIGEDKGKIAAPMAIGELGEPTAGEASPKIRTWPKVIGIDRV